MTTAVTAPLPVVPTTRSDARALRRAADDEQPRHRGVLAWLWYGVTAGLLVLVLAIGVVAVALPRFTGAVPLTVLTGSMEPTLPAGTMLVVRPVAADQMGQIRVGDVISYQPNPLDPTLITHRVTHITSLSDGGFIFTTQGDANPVADAPVREYQVRATLWYSIPGLGWVSDAINGQGNRGWIIPTVAGVLFAYAGFTVVQAIVRRVRRGRRAHETSNPPPIGPRHTAP